MSTLDSRVQSSEHVSSISRVSNNDLKWYEKDGYIITFAVIIVVDLICMGLNTFVLPSWFAQFVLVVDYLIQVAFIFDIIVKLISEKLNFCKNPWNWLDLLVTAVTAIPFGGWSQYSRVIRSIRVARSFRAFSHLHHLRDLVQIITNSMRGVLWTILLLLILFYCYAVVGTLMYGVIFNEWFGSLWKSMYTLFQIMTLEAWSDSIARPVIAEYPSSWIYFISFVILSAFIMMNVVVGIIVDTTHETQKKQRDLDNNPELLLEYEELEKIIEQLMRDQADELYYKIHMLVQDKKMNSGEKLFCDKEVPLKRKSSNFSNCRNSLSYQNGVIAPSDNSTTMNQSISTEVVMQDFPATNTTTESETISNPMNTENSEVIRDQINGNDEKISTDQVIHQNQADTCNRQ